MVEHPATVNGVMRKMESNTQSMNQQLEFAGTPEEKLLSLLTLC